LVADVGCAIVGATIDIAPADRRLYAIRDVTSTVESIDLITASILSKKLAAGLEALVLDVKVGSGAFMKSMSDAETLAKSLVKTANDAGCNTTALITDMNQPLAASAGNALEVMEALETMTGGDVNQRLWDVTVALGGEALVLAGLAEDVRDGADQIDEALRSGRVAEYFGRMVAALGGPVDFVERYPDRLPAAPVMCDVPATVSGFIAAIDGFAVGQAVVRLGGGRLKGGDGINPSVGLSEIMPLGERVEKGEVIARVHAATEDAAEQAKTAVAKSMKISTQPPEISNIIHKRIA
jgi:thymidine phosphorylase